MKMVLMLFGAMTLVAGFAMGVMEWGSAPGIPWWLPTSWIVGGVVGSVPWFAGAIALGELEELQSQVRQLRAESRRSARS